MTGKTPKQQPGEPKRSRRDDGFPARIRTIVREWGSANSFAREAGVSEAALRKWMAGQSEPTRDRLVSLARAAGVSLVWLATGTEPMRGAQEEMVAVSARPNVRASAGGGAPVYSEDRAPMEIPARWLQGLGVRPQDVEVISVLGDSMSPTLLEGDALVLDRREAGRVARDGVYAFTWDGELMVKRLQRQPDGSVRVSSDNPAYLSFVVGPEPGRELAIHGRVVGALKRL